MSRGMLVWVDPGKLNRKLSDEEYRRINTALERDAVIQQTNLTSARALTFDRMVKKVQIDETFLDRLEELQTLALRNCAPQ